MTDPDHRKLDWPVPVPLDGDEPPAIEALQLAAEGIREDLRRVPDDAAGAFVDLLARCFEYSPAPEESVAGIERLLHHEAENAADFVSLALADAAGFRRLFTALGHSRALGRHIALGGWRALLALTEQELATPLTADAVAARALALAASHDARVALRRNHHELMLRVMLREVSLRRPLEDIAREISALADGALAAALHIARADLQARSGAAEPDSFRFCVIGLGKHGAQELNYSSDIDLMFVFECPSPAAPRYAVRLAEAVITLLDEVTEDGFVARIDTRLRPEGKQGSLARSVSGTLNYYHSFGSTWERQALLKARACAGDLPMGAAMLDKLQAWVFRKYLTVEEINALQDVKRQIEKRTSERAETFLDVKTGFGGIRDIEFVTQFLQLLNGGRIPEVRCRDTLSALAALAGAGVLRGAEADQLAGAYRFLRSVEHRLQLRELHQTHSLPAEPAELARIGRAMGFGGPRALDPARKLVHELRAHTLRSRGLMVRLFAGLFDKPSRDESLLVLDPDMDGKRAAPVLARYRFSDTSGAFQAIRSLANESAENRLYAPRARKYLASMMPALLEFAAGSPDPDATLRNFERVAGNLGAKTILFELIAEDERALAIFGGIAAQSEWLSELLSRRPGLVDEFIDGLQSSRAQDRALLQADLGRRLADAESPLDALFWQRDVEVLRIGTFDITGRTPVLATLRELCVLAELILQAALELSLAREIQREGSGVVADPRGHLCVIGMGKLGSGALHYASDLDLVLAYTPGALDDAQREQAFYARVARGLIDTLTSTGERGKLYDVDLRLRPHGGKGTIAVSMAELERYLAGDAAFWERIAACRARVLTPAGPVGDHARRALDAFCFRGSDPAAMREMRARLQSAGSKGDLKRGAGGTLDIEFLLSHLQMKHGAGIPALRQPDVFAGLTACRDHGLIDARLHETLVDAYLFLRQCINRMQLFDGQPHDTLPEGAERERFAMRLGYKSGLHSASAQFEEELEWHRNAARAALDGLA